ncbi:MAG: InlB B-repeat-containing protein [Chitinivibrionales bacterium]
MSEATPKNGYEFVGWSGDTATDANPLTLTISKTYNIRAVYTLKSYTITTTANQGGIVDPGGDVEIMHGDDTTFTFTAETGYRIDSVKVDGEIDSAAKADGRLSFSEVSRDHTLEVFASLIPNSAPSLQYDGNTVFDEMDRFEIRVSAEDADDDELIFSTEFLDLPSDHDARFDEDMGVFTRPTTYEHAGEYAIQFKVSDGELYFTNDAFTTVAAEQIPDGAVVKDVQIGPNDDLPYVIVEDESGQLSVLN